MTWALLVFTLVAGGFDVERAGRFESADTCWGLAETQNAAFAETRIARAFTCVPVGGRRV